MKYLSLFSGIGGFELGMQNHECIGYSEIDKHAIQIYEKHFHHKNFGDITRIDEKSLPDFELLVGGFPCQAFSIAGLRRGFADTRGTLFFDIARILSEKRPRLLLLENVKGLLSHDSGRTFATIIATLTDLGYDLQWQVINSKNHGVAQNRERILIVGNLRGTPRPEVFPITGSDSNTVPGDQKGKDRIADTITGRYAGRNGRGTHIEQLNNPRHSNDRIYDPKGISPTLNTMQGGRRQPFIVASRGRNPKNPSDRTTGAPTEQRLEINKKGTSNTLTSVQKDNMVLKNSKIRRLTPMECERLQGFPDGWTEGASDTQRYKTLGNAVTVNVIRDIVEKLSTSAS
jgi:DNA (cytosine-5)-methyltransferase 1